MKSNLVVTSATSALVMAMLAPVTTAAQTGEAVVELRSEIDADASAWSVDRADVASFINTNWEGRDDVIKLSITPPAEPTSFRNWQGYHQLLDTPAGSASVMGDMWIGSDWAAGTDTDFVRTGIWGSVQPEGSDSYIDAQSIFPIISFTNEDGEARLQVWDTTANPTSGWVDLNASESALNLDSWNKFEMRVLPDADRIDYVVNGAVIYSWDMPRAAAENASDEFWAVYLNGRNNGVTSFDTYWSNLAQAQLVLDGETLTAAPDGFNILANATGGISIDNGVSIGGTVHSGSGSTAALTFGEESGVATTGDGEIAVVSDEGGSVALGGGSVATSGANAHGLYATGMGSKIATDATTVSVTGAGSFGAYATDDGEIVLNGGSVSSNRAALVADGGAIKATDTALSTTVPALNGNDVGAVTALNGGSADLTGGTITLSGGRMAGLLALSEGTITAEGVSISATGDRVRGVYASADEIGGGSVTVSGGSIETDGLLSHGMFAKRQSGTIADTVAHITASDIDISVNGPSANGIYADVGSVVTVNNATVTTGGEGGAGLHAQGYDDGMSGEGTIGATNVNVVTSGASAYGGYSELGGELTLNGGSVSTTGSQAHGLVAVGTADHVSEIAASDVTVSVTGEGAFGIGISGTGNISFKDGSIATADDTIGVQSLAGSSANFIISGSTLSSSGGTLLDVDRELDDGTGIVSLVLSDGTAANGNILDTGPKTTGYTDVTLDNATLTGAVDGLRNFTLSGGATWAATGAGSIGTMTVGAGGGAIDVAADSTVALSGALTGSGGLSKEGNGSLVLSGDGSAYSGTATIEHGMALLTGSLAGNVVINEEGTFQIGNGDETGDLTGSTVNNGLLIFARSGDYDYTGALSGDGDLIKQGDGTLLLSGDYSYTGQTVVEGGIVKLASKLDEDTNLVIDNGTFDLSDKTQTVAGLAGTGGTLALGATGALTVVQTGSSTYAGSMTGSAATTVTFTGGGHTNLTGSSDNYLGYIVITDLGSVVSINGDYSNASLTVMGGGGLGGNGYVGHTQILSGGTARPGNSIGTLHVVGDIEFLSGSLYQVEVDAEGHSDTIIASGAATLEGGMVSVLAQMGDYARFSDYLILSAEGGVTGTFEGSDVDLPFLDATLNYGPTEVLLTLARNDESFTSAAVTPNQIAVAASLDGMPANSAVSRAIASQTTASTAQAAFDALSGELWASTGTALLDQVRSTGEAVLGRLRQAGTLAGGFAGGRGNATTTRGGKTAIWGEGSVRWNDLDSDGNAAGMSLRQTGFLTGIDTGVADWRLGAAFGHSEGDADVTARGSSATTESNTLAVYASGSWGPLSLNAGGSYGWHKIDGERAIVFPSFSETAQGHYDGRSASVFGEVGYGMVMGKARLEPFAGVNYVHLKTDGFTETGAASAQLTVDETKRNVTFTSLGLRVRGDIPTSDVAVISPHLSAAWQHALGDDADAFGDHTLPGGSAFRVEGLPLAQDALLLDAGLDAVVTTAVTIGISYTGNIADRWSDHGVKVGIAYQF